MKYIQSLKFKALGILLASAVATATATPSLATPHSFLSDPTGSGLSDPTGPGLSDPTGPGLSDPTGAKVSDPSGHSLDPSVKKELHYSLNSQQTAAIKAIILQLRQEYKAAVTPAQRAVFFKVTLPAAKLAYLAIAKPTDPTGPGHATSLTGLKDELKGKHADRSPW
jgi:hypothetical protein